jgi:uncharacterized protein
MTVELRPYGVMCNLGCTYCYQNPQREARNLGVRYDLDAMKRGIRAEGGPFSLFGGEPLLVRVEHLEDLWSWGLDHFGSNGIQTNGALINDEHIRLFRTYKVHVGISIDGPGELNDARWAGTLDRTRQATAATEAAIERLCAEGMAPSLIVTLSRMNAVEERLPRLAEWFGFMAALGITSARLHLLEVENEEVRRTLSLSQDENIRALEYFQDFSAGNLRFDVFEDLRRMLLGQDNNTTCVWNACDPYTTRAVRGVEGQGQRSNCGRTNKDGIDFLKAAEEGFERYVALYFTAQEYGGCRGCRFFLMCKGQCPGTALDGDWRNRTEHCGVWKAIYRQVEHQLLDEGKFPLSCNPLRPQIERHLINGWRRGENSSMQSYLASVRAVSETRDVGAQGHGDHTDGHGDSHGDHTDGLSAQVDSLSSKHGLA